MKNDQRKMDLEDAAAKLRRVVQLRKTEMDQAERVKQLQLELRDARDALDTTRYQLRSVIDDVGGEDGPLFRHLDQG